MALCNPGAAWAMTTLAPTVKGQSCPHCLRKPIRSVIIAGLELETAWCFITLYKKKVRANSRSLLREKLERTHVCCYGKSQSELTFAATGKVRANSRSLLREKSERTHVCCYGKSQSELTFAATEKVRANSCSLLREKSERTHVRCY
jgi:hypothetical protein